VFCTTRCIWNLALWLYPDRNTRPDNFADDADACAVEANRLLVREAPARAADGHDPAYGRMAGSPDGFSRRRILGKPLVKFSGKPE
jgi:hypothetical protein